jgi:hypothetical protein
MIDRMMRHFFCSTEWARKQGITSNKLRLFSFSSAPSEARGPALLLLVVLLLTLLVVEFLGGLSRSISVNRHAVPDQVQKRHPGKAAVQPTAARANASTFGPVIERVLCNAQSASDPAFLNLETGRVFTRSEVFGTNLITGHFPLDLTQTDVFSVLSRQGISMGVDLEAKPPRFFVWECATHGIGQFGWNAADEPDAKQPGWDKSLRDIFDQLPAPRPGMCNILTAELPAVWLLKSRSGRQVVLEITGLTDHPRSVKIRYKLVPERRDEGK